MPHTYSARKVQSVKEPRARRRVPETTHRYPDRQEIPKTNLTRLIEQDAPLFSHSNLVLMYGFFQAEMTPDANQGVASWIRDCIRQYGLPSLVRFDSHRRAQIFRRDQFQPWLEPLMDQAC